MLTTGRNRREVLPLLAKALAHQIVRGLKVSSGCPFNLPAEKRLRVDREIADSKTPFGAIAQVMPVSRRSVTAHARHPVERLHSEIRQPVAGPTMVYAPTVNFYSSGAEDGEQDPGDRPGDWIEDIGMHQGIAGRGVGGYA